MVLKLGHFAKEIRNTCEDFFSVVLQKNGDQMDLSCEKLRSVL